MENTAAGHSFPLIGILQNFSSLSVGATHHYGAFTVLYMSLKYIIVWSILVEMYTDLLTLLQKYNLSESLLCQVLLLEELLEMRDLYLLQGKGDWVPNVEPQTVGAPSWASTCCFRWHLWFLKILCAARVVRKCQLQIHLM